MALLPQGHVLAAALACIALTAGSLAAHAVEKPYPTRPIRLIVPSTPGGGTDASARVVSPRLAERLGQQVVLEYRPGAAAMIGMEAGARAAPDGYTLLMAQSTLTIVPSVYRQVRFDPVKDFAPISLVAVVPLMLVGHPSLPAGNLKELLALARTRPGEIDYAAGGYGGTSHLAMEHLLSMARVRMTHVPYKSANAGLVDAMSGRIPVMLSNVLVALPHVKSGRFRPYGVTSARRVAEAPEVPTIAEAGVPGYEVMQWFGLLAPAATPREILNRLHREFVLVMQDKDVRKRFSADGADPVFSRTPDEFATLVRTEVARWAKVAKNARLELQ